MSRPIGIFDSGIGGLTIASAIRKALPMERLLYFGDTAHFPYGEKSPDAVRGYATGITEFLLKYDPKAVVIACNTASAHASMVVQRIAGDAVPAFNVIDPIADHVAAQWKEGRIGVIGTRGTIGSQVYAQAIKERAPQLQVSSLATPLLAPIIEEGFYNNSISLEIIERYLRHRYLRDIDALVLGCTHYPLIKGEVEQVVGPKVAVLDPPTIVAEHIVGVMSGAGSLSGDPAGTEEENDDHFYLSDLTRSFAQSASRFFKQQMKVKEMRIWGY